MHTLACERQVGVNTCYGWRACGRATPGPDRMIAVQPEQEVVPGAESPLPAGRRAGVCLHLTALPGDYGIGEIGSQARRFIDFIADAGLRVWQFLPTGPTAYGDSPYQPLSSFAGNEMLVDIDGLLEWQLLLPDETAPLRALPEDHVDYGRLIPVKHALLRRAATRFPERAPGWLRDDYAAFLEQNDESWLRDYALFRLLKSEHGERPWPEWPKRYVHRESAALERFAAERAQDLERIKIVQFLFDAQWAELRRHAEKRGVWLFGDMPIYIALDSADAWANREMLQIDAEGRPSHVAGVPPDYFSEDGQLWGNPLYDWDYHERHGYSWWIERLRHVAARSDLVRIDHFRGFESYWSVPADETTARNGRWEPGPGDRIFDALREALGHLPIVAEDLGVITPEVEALRDRHRMPGMVILQFDVCDEAFDLAQIRKNSVCYTGTHDNDTTLGWFTGSPGDNRSRQEIADTQRRVLEVTGGDASTVTADLVRLAMQSPSRLAIAPLQDFLGLGSAARFNTPGKPRDNWRWRTTSDQLSGAFARDLARLVRESQRGA